MSKQGKTPLEKAIMSSKSIALEQGRNELELIIHQEKFASRKRARLAVISSGLRQVDESTERDEDGESDAEVWRDKYDKLNHEREMARREQDEQLIKAQQRITNLEQYVTALKKKIEILEKAVPDKKHSENYPLQNENGKQSNIHGEEHKELLDVVKFYEQMTSMSVRGTSVDRKAKTKTFTCTVKNTIKRQATRFEVETGEVEFNFIPKVNVDMLPEYIQANIVFEPAAAPVVMGDILSKLYAENDE